LRPAINKLGIKQRFPETKRWNKSENPLNNSRYSEKVGQVIFWVGGEEAEV
jgi:hypothetical protein